MRGLKCLFVLWLVFTVSEAIAEEDIQPGSVIAEEDEMEYELLDEYEGVSDPLESWNRVVFTFNDRLYFWALKPIAQGYSKVVGEEERIIISNFFYHLLFPVRFANGLFQGKFQIASKELARFGINSTFGMLGFQDIARDELDLKRHDEDLGQTMGFYGLGDGFYLVLPFLGPSSLRDTVGLIGDSFLNISNIIIPLLVESELGLVIGVRSYEAVNDTSLKIGEYEDLKKASIDLYITVQDAYSQYRKDQIKK